MSDLTETESLSSKNKNVKNVLCDMDVFTKCAWGKPWGKPMYCIHNEGKSVIAERFIKTLKLKIYKRMTTNDSKSYLPDLNELVD